MKKKRLPFSEAVEVEKPSQNQAQLGGETQQAKTLTGGEAMTEQYVMENAKFLLEDLDWFWPVGWWILPTGEEVYVVKESPYKSEEACLILEKWTREELEKIFWRIYEEKKEGRRGGVALEENWSEEEREKAEEWVLKRRAIEYFVEEEIWQRGKAFFNNYPNFIKKYKAILEKLIPEEFWDWDRREQEKFIRELYSSVVEEGVRQGYHLYICL